MLYSLFLVTFGVFLGQEYPIPSIKKLTSNIYNYNFNNFNNFNTNKETNDNLSINKILEYLNNFKKKED